MPRGPQLYLQPVLNPKSYDGARVLEASGRCTIQERDVNVEVGTKLAEDTAEKSAELGTTGNATSVANGILEMTGEETGSAGTKLIT